MDESELSKKFAELLDLLKSKRSNDRTEQDRFIAIAITDIEKAKAVIYAYTSLM